MSPRKVPDYEADWNAPPLDPARNWPEDVHLENGGYLSNCLFCKRDFVGHKRRVTCKLCSAEPPASDPLPSVPPEDPRKCPSCGTKLIPASQAFREIRERITAEEPPELTEAIEQIITELDACSGDLYNPPALNTDAIKRELESIRAMFAQREAGITDLCALLRDVNNESLQTEAQVASLSSQLERLKKDSEVGVICRWCGELQSGVEAGSSVRWVVCPRCDASEIKELSESLERLKAEQLTAEEAQHALDQIPDNQCGWPPKDCPVCDSLRGKLRRQSDTGAHP